MKTHLGTIIDSFVMTGMGRVLVLNRDCSKDISTSGEKIEIHMPDGKIAVVEMLDGLLDSGAKHGIDAETVSALRVEDGGFEGVILKGSEVYKA